MIKNKLSLIFKIIQDKFHFERINTISKITNKILGDEDTFYINYYFNEFQIYPETVFISAFLFSISFFLMIAFLTIVFHNFIFFLFSIFISYLIYKKISSFFKRKYHSERAVILSYSDLVFQEFILVMNTNKSIFDSIKFISSGDYPILSNDFRKIIFKINYGETPETALLDYIEKQPCQSFKNKMLSLINSNFSSNYITTELERDSSDIYFEYDKINKELDSKLILIIGFSIFIPILISITLSFYSVSTNYLILLIFPIYYFISIIIEKKTFSYDLLLLGDFTRNEKIDEQEFDNLINFFSLFSFQIKNNFSPEKSFMIAINKFKGILKKDISDLINQMFISNLSLEEFLSKLSKIVQSSQSTRFLEIISRMILFDSQKAGERIQFMISRIKRNQELIKKRKMIFESQKFKINVLCIILNGILGLICSISPLISMSSMTLFNSELFNLQEPQIYLFFPIIILLAIISIYSTYFVLKIFKITQKELKTSIYFLIFVFIFFISSELIII